MLSKSIIPKKRPRNAAARQAVLPFADLQRRGIHFGMASHVLKHSGLTPAERLSTFNGLLSTLEVTVDPYAPPQEAAIRTLLNSAYARLVWHVEIEEAALLRDMPVAFSVFTDQLTGTSKEHLLLFSLSADITYSQELLDQYLALIDSIPYPCIVDPVHRSWKSVRSQTHLKNNKAAIVSLDAPTLFGIIKDSSYTSPSRSYLRLLGRDPKKWFEPLPERHEYDYSQQELHDIALRIQALRQTSEDVTVIFCTHPFDSAYKNALALAKQLLALQSV